MPGLRERTGRTRPTDQDTAPEAASLPETDEDASPDETATRPPVPRLRLFFFWGVLVLVFAAGLLAIYQDVRTLVFGSRSNAAAAPAGPESFPREALNWGAPCVRAFVQVDIADPAYSARRDAVMRGCISAQYVGRARGVSVDGGTGQAPRPLKVAEVRPERLIPHSADRALAVYSVQLADDVSRVLWYAADIYAGGANAFVMEAPPHRVAPLTQTAVVSPELFATDPALPSQVQPFVDNFFRAYFSNNTAGMVANSTSREAFPAPLNEFGEGGSPYLGITTLLVQKADSDYREALVIVRVKDAYTNLVTEEPYRIRVVKQDTQTSTGVTTLWFVDDILNNP